MKLSLNSQVAERSEAMAANADGSCKIVVFWQDFDAAIHARKSFDSIVQNLSGGLPVEASSWSFSMLGSPTFNAAVLMDAARADVIVVAARGDQEVPECVATWLELSLMRNKGNTPMVVALHDERLDSSREAAPLCSLLEKIAARQGACFACSQDLAELGADAAKEAPPPSYMSRAIPSYEPADASHAATQRWCGINE